MAGAAVVCGATAGGAGAQGVAAADLRQACNAPALYSVLRADARHHDARAVWLDARRLQWPGAPVAPSGGRYRLHHAAAGGIGAEPGTVVTGTDGALTLQPLAGALPAALAARFAYLAPGLRLQIAPADADEARLRTLHRGQLLLVQEDAAGRVLQATALQHAGALDALYAAAEALPDLGVTITPAPPGAATPATPVSLATNTATATAPVAAPATTPATTPTTTAITTRFKLWAPTAQAVWLCHFADDRSPAAVEVPPMQRDEATGAWALALPGDASGGYYNVLVDVWVPGTGLVRQRVTDPYAISLGADSRRAWIGRLDAPATQPPGWVVSPQPQPPGLAAALPPKPLRGNTDLVIYELHVRDFSIGDASVPVADRGKYAAFSHASSHGMRHLRALGAAGLSDVHLLPVFDLASVPEVACTTPTVPAAAPDSPAQQAAVMGTVAAGAATDCYNWGYDPLHFNAPEGSFASRADDGAVRIREFRQMVLGLHRAGLRVGMDVVYNHLSAAGQHKHSVLDRIVPGYYHRLNAVGAIERSTCCDNSATEHRMMGKLMLDSVRLWAREYRIDSFRFDLMGHQPREAMVALRDALRTDAGREIHLLGEGWNFGEVANGARFVQAAQGVLNGSGIATFSDRARDAMRGGGVGDGPTAVVARQGWLNGLAYDPNEAAQAAGPPDVEQLKAAADLVRLGLAGTLRSVRFTTAAGVEQTGEQMRYAGQPAGYASQPGEAVNYVENHDNHTLWDVNAFKLPLATSAADRARVQVLGLAVTAFSQGAAYFHAGSELLRSKSMDGNSYDSGDWFNRLDWTAQTNFFGTGLPPAPANQALWPLIAPRLADARLKPAPADIAFARDAFGDLLRIRASSTLFRLTSAAEVQQRLVFHNTGPQQNPVLIAVELDGTGLPGAGFGRVLVLLNADKTAQSLAITAARGQGWVLHPVHRAPAAADRRAANDTRFDAATGRFTVPARTAVVYVLP